jgi:hypothetical protein
MPSFEDLFLKSNGQPVEYDGQTIQMIDRLPVTDGQQLCIAFESVNSEWRQGIHLTTDGAFEVNGQTVKKVVVLWQNTAPRVVVLRIKSKKGECLIKNVWDVGDGVMHSWHNRAAMIVEDHASFRRYRCNDGRADDDFDDLIFTLELNRSGYNA